MAVRVSHLLIFIFACKIINSSIAVWFSAIGRIDMKGIMQSMTRKDYIRDMIWWTEKARHEWRLEQERTGHRRPFTNCIIADSDQLGLSRLSNRARRPIISHSLKNQ